MVEQVDMSYTMQQDFGSFQTGMIKSISDRQISRTEELRRANQLKHMQTISEILGPRVSYLTIIIENPPSAILNTSRKVKRDCKKINGDCTRHGMLMTALNIASLLCMLITLGALLLHVRDTEVNYSLFGYSAFSVQTAEAQREIPEGSLVITQRVKPRDIQAGDNINFRNGTSVITSRVTRVGNKNGFPVFQTDMGAVSANEMIGVVRLYIPGLGNVLTFVMDRAVEVTLISFLLTAVFFLAKLWLMRVRRSQQMDAEPTEKIHLADKIENNAPLNSAVAI